MHPLTAALTSCDRDALRALLTQDVVMWPPAVAPAIRGRERVLDLMAELSEVLSDLEVLDVTRGDNREILRWTARVGQRQLDGVDVLRTSARGIEDITVMARPMSALAGLAAAVAPRLARPRGRGLAAVVRVGSAPLPVLLDLSDRAATRLIGSER